MRFAWLAAVLLLPSGCGGADSGETTGEARGAIHGGQTDTADVNVVGIVVSTAKGQTGCSGSLIAPNLVLTARHCVAAISSPVVDCDVGSFGSVLPTTAFKVSTSLAFTLSGTGVSRVIVPESARLCGQDIALLVLSQSVPAATATPLAPRLDDGPHVGESYRAVGFGATDAQNHGVGTRRVRSGLDVKCTESCSFMGLQIDPNEWRGDTGICEGDSGGPALDTENRVIGVVSRGAVEGVPGGPPCDYPVYANLTQHAELIRSAARTAAALGGYPEPPWVTSTVVETAGSGAGGAAGASGSAGAPAATVASRLETVGGCAVAGQRHTNGAPWLAAFLAVAIAGTRRRK